MTLEIFRTRKFNIKGQYLISISLIIFIAIISFFSVDIIGYQVVALILLLAVSILAMMFDILPVMVTAILSALIWNFFFIPPILTFHTGSPEDALMFLMYFVIALINAVLTFKIREFERKARDEKEKEKSLKLYNTLLNSLSHELRTPISTIIGALDTIRDTGISLTPENRNKLFSEMEIASFRLNRQVENLLSMSRLEAGILQPKMDWCDLNELIFTVIKDTKEDAHHYTIEFKPDDQLPFFKTDRGLIEQVLLNIIHNCLQHTPINSTIEIKVNHVKNCCKISVSDNGPGFPASEIPFVFDKFYKLTNSAVEGTGLGLSIVKGFTEALGGTVKLENKDSGGAKFTILIPAETTAVTDNYEQNRDTDN